MRILGNVGDAPPPSLPSRLCCKRRVTVDLPISLRAAEAAARSVFGSLPRVQPVGHIGTTKRLARDSKTASSTAIGPSKTPVNTRNYLKYVRQPALENDSLTSKCMSRIVGRSRDTFVGPLVKLCGSRPLKTVNVSEHRATMGPGRKTVNRSIVTTFDRSVLFTRKERQKNWPKLLGNFLRFFPNSLRTVYLGRGCVGRRRWRRRRRRRPLFARMTGRRFHLGYGVEHVVEPVPLVVVQRHRPAVALGDAAVGQQSRGHGLAPGPRLYAGRGRAAVGHGELQRRVEPLPVGPPLQQTRRRRPGGRRARVPGQQLPLAHALVTVVTAVGHVPAGHSRLVNVPQNYVRYALGYTRNKATGERDEFFTAPSSTSCHTGPVSSDSAVTFEALPTIIIAFSKNRPSAIRHSTG